MARSADPLRRDNIEVQATGTGARLAAPATDPALQLASALSDIEPTAQQFVQGQMDKQLKTQQEKAHRDVLVASGAKLADAVRDGTLEATSNPWYVAAYNRESAAIRGQAALSQLQTDSASWAEKNDPQAFATRWRSEVGKIAGGFSSKDETAGFAPVEGQFTQQALQSNVSQNVTRIVAERKQNLSALAASALGEGLQKNGGVLTPNQAAALLDPARQQFLATGGSQADWNEMAVGAVTTAAYATHNSGALDLLHAPELVHGPSDGGNAPIGDGVAGNSAPPLPITPIASVAPADLVPGKRWTSDQLSAVVPFNGRVTSGVRSAAHNAAIGGVPNSQHVAGTAIDVVFPKGTTPDAVRAYYAQQGAAVDVIHEGANDPHSTGDHFHIQGARNPTVLATAAAVPVASVQSQDTPAIAAPPQAVSPTDQPVRGASLYDMAGVADKVESDRYRITQARDAAQFNRLRQAQATAQLEGFNGYTAMYQAHGTAILSGQVTSQQIIQEMTHAGYTPQGIAEALKLFRGDIQDNAGIATARLALNSSDPAQARQLFDLHVQAVTRGSDPTVADRLGRMVLAGQIGADTAASIVASGVNTDRRLIEQNRADANYAYTQQQRQEQATSGLKAHRALAASTGDIAGIVTTKMSNAGLPIPSKLRSSIRSQLSDAAGAYLDIHPGDFAGAQAAARNAGAAYIRRIIASRQRRPGAATPSSTSANPRSR